MLCPKCKRDFSGEGFCPFDGTTLIGNEDLGVKDFADDARTVDVHGSRTQFGTGAPPIAGKESGARRRASKPSSYGSDDLATRSGESKSTLSGSAVAKVLQDVIDNRGVDPLIGAELDGRYKIEKQIGEGGMGIVYLARHMVIEKLVAIKVLREEVAADENVVKRFVREAKAASRIGHPNIIDVTDFGTTANGLTYQVMEYLQGSTLSDALRKADVFTLSRALPIIAQMARALGAAHQKGIVHRDLKPDNVFLMKRDGRTDFVKIVDFGIAKMGSNVDNPEEPRLTRVGTVFGTPEYMAPEQAAGRTDVDRRADVYALGTILYEMLVGRVPHRGESTVRTLAMQMLDKPKSFAEARPGLDIGKDVEAVVMRSLAKKREDRYEDMDSFLAALEAVTTNTELDLPQVVLQERLSAELEAQDPEREFDTVPETDLVRPKSPTSAHQVAEQAAEHESQKRRRGRSTDPAFLRRQGSTSMPIMEQVEPEETEPNPRDTRKKGWLVAFALLLVGGSVSAFLLTRPAKQEDGPALAAVVSDAAVPVRALPPDAQAAPLAVSDATVAPADAAATPTSGRHRDPDPKNPGERDPIRKPVLDPVRPALPKGNLEVTIVTRPRGAQLFIGNSYAGSDGTNLRRKAGTTLRVNCQLAGFLDGSVKVTFDGEREVFLCRLRETRKGRCVDGVKNPFDDCP